MKSQSEPDSSHLLLGMVEKVCAPILERTLDKIELEALRESSARLRTENAELRDALKIPRGMHAGEEVIASAAQSYGQHVAAQTTDPAPQPLESPADPRPAVSIPARSAAVLLWPFATAPVGLQQLAPTSNAPPAWVLVYQRAWSEQLDAARTVKQLLRTLRSADAAYAPVRRGMRSWLLEFIW